MSILLWWDTYPFRREIASMGWIYDYTEKAHRLPKNETTINRSREKWFDIHTSDIDITDDYKVHNKNVQSWKRADKWSLVSDRKNSEATKYEDSKAVKDFLSLWEPVKVWHHSEKRHRKLIDKSRKNRWKRVELHNEADEAERKSEYRKNKKYKTAEEKRLEKEYIAKLSEKALILWSQEYRVWDIYVWWHTSFTIAKINKKTVQSESGSNRDIKYSKDFQKYLDIAKTLI